MNGIVACLYEYLNVSPDQVNFQKVRLQYMQVANDVLFIEIRVRLCSRYTGKLSARKAIRYRLNTFPICDSPLERSALRQRNRVEITVLTCI